MTKQPATRVADIALHGVIENYLTVLIDVQLQKTEQLKTSVTTTEASIGIEGANVMGVRITEVKEKDELELLSKSMTVKVSTILPRIQCHVSIHYSVIFYHLSLTKDE